MQQEEDLLRQVRQIQVGEMAGRGKEDGRQANQKKLKQEWQEQLQKQHQEQRRQQTRSEKERGDETFARKTTKTRRKERGRKIQRFGR